MGILIGVVAVIASVGVAVAATLQITRALPSNLNIQTAQVLSSENLQVFWDEAGTEPISDFDISVIDFQPPLENQHWHELVYVRNDADIPLRIVDPCHGVSDNVTEQGFGHIELRHEHDERGSCDWHE